MLLNNLPSLDEIVDSRRRCMLDRLRSPFHCLLEISNRLGLALLDLFELIDATSGRREEVLLSRTRFFVCRLRCPLLFLLLLLLLLCCRSRHVWLLSRHFYREQCPLISSSTKRAARTTASSLRSLMEIPLTDAQGKSPLHPLTSLSVSPPPSPNRLRKAQALYTSTLKYQQSTNDLALTPSSSLPVLLE